MEEEEDEKEEEEDGKIQNVWQKDAARYTTGFECHYSPASNTCDSVAVQETDIFLYVHK